MRSLPALHVSTAFLICPALGAAPALSSGGSISPQSLGCSLLEAQLPTCCIAQKSIKFGSQTSLLGLFFMFPHDVTVKLQFLSWFVFTSLLSPALAQFVIFSLTFITRFSPVHDFFFPTSVTSFSPLCVFLTFVPRFSPV